MHFRWGGGENHSAGVSSQPVQPLTECPCYRRVLTQQSKQDLNRKDCTLLGHRPLSVGGRPSAQDAPDILFTLSVSVQNEGSRICL